MLDKMLFCLICKQSCYLNEIYIYQVKKKTRPNFISMRMVQKLKFIWFNVKCKETYPLEKFYHNEMFECVYLSI